MSIKDPERSHERRRIPLRAAEVLSSHAVCLSIAAVNCAPPHTHTLTYTQTHTRTHRLRLRRAIRCRRREEAAVDCTPCFSVNRKQSITHPAHFKAECARLNQIHLTTSLLKFYLNSPTNPKKSVTKCTISRSQRRRRDLDLTLCVCAQSFFHEQPHLLSGASSVSPASSSGAPPGSRSSPRPRHCARSWFPVPPWSLRKK